MIDNRYLFESSPDLMTFEFDSIGPKGIITKVVRYTEINVYGFYNLGFGDRDPQSGYISDLAITDNKDNQKVLATVARTLMLFTERYPEAVVFATGSTLARTRLYQMGISNNLAGIQIEFAVLGLTKEQIWEPFKKSIIYHSFESAGSFKFVEV